MLDYGESQLYTLEDVKAAGDVVIEYFKTSGGYEGCKMLWIYYDEEESREMSGGDGKEVISFWVEYKIGVFSPRNEFEVPQTDNSCGWWLEREDLGELWKIVAAGEP